MHSMSNGLAPSPVRRMSIPSAISVSMMSSVIGDPAIDWPLKRDAAEHCQHALKCLACFEGVVREVAVQSDAQTPRIEHERYCENCQSRD